MKSAGLHLGVLKYICLKLRLCINLQYKTNSNNYNVYGFNQQQRSKSGYFIVLHCLYLPNNIFKKRAKALQNLSHKNTPKNHSRNRNNSKSLCQHSLIFNLKCC